jgi:hypothetical protein
MVFQRPATLSQVGNPRYIKRQNALALSIQQKTDAPPSPIRVFCKSVKVGQHEPKPEFPIDSYGIRTESITWMTPFD